MNAVLELASVTVRRGQATLLDSVDWMVEEDERWVILGPNGAGKTTLMQICSAQIHPTSGVAGILGEVVGTDLPGPDRVQPRGQDCGDRQGAHSRSLGGASRNIRPGRVG